jgi:membrane protease subunit HflC
MNNQTSFATGVFLMLAGLLILTSSVYVLDVTQQVFTTRFGKIVGEPVTEPGLKFKVPIIDKLHYFDKRYLEWDGQANQVTTRDKLFIQIDTYARWRILDPKTFFEKVKDEIGAKTRLNDILNGAAREAIAKENLAEVVRSEQREEIASEPQQEGEQEGISGTSVLKEFHLGREEISHQILERAKPDLADFGIELLDFRFKRINYAPEVQVAIYKRMIEERKQMAEKFRSEGQGEAAIIEGTKLRKLDTVQSEASRQVKEIKGQADAEAIKIYAEAYNQSPEAREFYAFLQTLEAYKTSISNKDNIIFTTDSEFYRYLRNSQNLQEPTTTEK